MDIYAFLARHNIAYERCDHPAVFTCEESDRLVPHLPGKRTKNLFLKTKKGDRYFLVVVECGKSTDLKALSTVLDVKGLTFGSPEELKKMLGVEPGSVTLLGLISDEDHAVHVIIDREMWEADFLQCHPMVNTASLVIAHADIETFLKITQHDPRIVDVPARV